MKLGTSWGYFAAMLVAVCTLFAPAADAAFVGPFVLSNWTLINTNGNGSATTLDGGNSVILSGSNNGSGLPGITDLVITVPVDDTLSFGWSYFSLDAPGNDLAGYLIGSQFVLLSGTTGTSGNSSLALQAGQNFGFSVHTTDNIGEPGILTITQFSASQSSAVPEPGGISLALLGAALLVLVRCGERRSVPKCNLPGAWRIPEFSDPIFPPAEQAVEPTKYRGKHDEIRVEWCSRGCERHG